MTLQPRRGAVDGYAVNAVATTTACDVLYSEIWFTTDTYDELRAYVEQLRARGHGRPVVLAMYPQYGQDVGTMLQAEAAALNGVSIATDHAGWSGTGFVAGFDQEDDAIRWDIELAEESTVSFVVRYANATGTSARRTLLLDGARLGSLTFPSRSSWDDWSSDAWIQVRSVAPGNHEVSLSYQRGDWGAVNVDRLTLGVFDEASVRLQNAVVFASGATPIQLGDDVQSLSHEYFPNRSKSLGPDLRRALRDQYSFITAHENVLFGRDVEPIPAPLEHVTALAPAQKLITSGTDGIWTLLRRSTEGELLHFVNLVGVDNELWRDAAPRPQRQEHVRLRYRVAQADSVREVLWATPDAGPGAFQPLPFSVHDDAIEFELPRLEYWDVVLVRL